MNLKKRYYIYRGHSLPSMNQTKITKKRKWWGGRRHQGLHAPRRNHKWFPRLLSCDGHVILRKAAPRTTPPLPSVFSPEWKIYAPLWDKWSKHISSRIQRNSRRAGTASESSHSAFSQVRRSKPATVVTLPPVPFSRPSTAKQAGWLWKWFRRRRWFSCLIHSRAWDLFSRLVASSTSYG